MVVIIIIIINNNDNNNNYHSWYHICLGLDTVTGLLRITANGRLIVNEENKYFKNTTSIKPKSLVGKVNGKFDKCMYIISILLCDLFQFLSQI